MKDQENVFNAQPKMEEWIMNIFIILWYSLITYLYSLALHAFTSLLPKMVKPGHISSHIITYHNISEKQHFMVTLSTLAEHNPPDDLMGTVAIKANAPHVWEGSSHKEVHSLGHELAIHITNVDWHFCCRKCQLLLCPRIKQQARTRASCVRTPANFERPNIRLSCINCSKKII